MIDFGVSLIGERRVAERFDRFPEASRAALLGVITRLTAQLEGAVVAAVPSRTGALRATIRSGVENKERAIRGWVSMAGGDKNAVLKAMALEYGSNKKISVSEHRRAVDTVFGRAVAPYEQLVAAHSRTTNIVAQRFLRDPLAAMAADALAQMKAAVGQASAAA